jgi:hypothetical protein
VAGDAGILSHPSHLCRKTGADDEIARRDLESHGEEDHLAGSAEIIGVCDRTMRLMRKQYEEFGYNGLFR